MTDTFRERWLASHREDVRDRRIAALKLKAEKVLRSNPTATVAVNARLLLELIALASPATDGAV